MPTGACLLVCLAFCLCTAARPAQKGASALEYRILVRRLDRSQTIAGDFDHEMQSKPSALAMLNRTHVSSSADVEVFRVSNTALDPFEACEALQLHNADVELCEADQRLSIAATSASPNDPRYSDQTYLANISVPAAWRTGQLGTASVRVCVVDTGLDYTHPDLVANLWNNPAERTGPGANAANGYQNGVDDDNNGIIDDLWGADFTDGASDGKVEDQNGHGTAVAGIIGAVGNNGQGITGINQVASIITCRFMDSTGNGFASDAIRCLDYCTAMGAHVITLSAGGTAQSSALQTAISAATARGVLLVASAGNNDGSDDTTAHYPASLSDPGIIAVGASTSNKTLWSGSNYGKNTVAMLAPGVNILSTGLGGTYTTTSGTSMAAPMVAGAAALLLAQFAQNGANISTQAPNMGLARQVKSLLLANADPLSAADAGKVGGGFLNVAAALAAVPQGGSLAVPTQAPPNAAAFDPSVDAADDPMQKSDPGGGNAELSIDAEHSYP
ncbi:hypothetical protein WJX73_004495 [Symbiochloris irregularis]|uniref:Peptidase S8/S53 domain-containing protein n=1 Tax=Symbiochloris irregularis TaxID=706552 RepID=A0AAW1PSA0_9CHLO